MLDVDRDKVKPDVKSITVVVCVHLPTSGVPLRIHPSSLPSIPHISFSRFLPDGCPLSIGRRRRRPSNDAHKKYTSPPPHTHGFECRLALCVATYLLGNFINPQVHNNSPFFVVLFPVLGALFLLMLMPVAAFASYPADFLGLSLINPKHFFYVAKRTWGSMKQNDLKVKAKDL
jgi:hypothetical protein